MGSCASAWICFTFFCAAAVILVSLPAFCKWTEAHTHTHTHRHTCMGPNTLCLFTNSFLTFSPLLCTFACVLFIWARALTHTHTYVYLLLLTLPQTHFYDIQRQRGVCVIMSVTSQAARWADHQSSKLISFSVSAARSSSWQLQSYFAW